LISRDLASDSDCRAIQFLEPVLKAHRGQFVAAGVERERLKYLGAGFAKLNVQFP